MSPKAGSAGRPLAVPEQLHWSPTRRAIGALVGNTPLVDLTHLVIPGRLVEVQPVRLYAKLEMANPGGSIKDRAALAMILDAELRGLLQPGKVILDATSGNTGIALAMLGSATGYHVTLAIPSNASPERRAILHAHGAELILTDPLEGTDGSQRVARQLAAEEPSRYVYLDQYNNEANWKAHHRTTGVEIWEQTQGRITHFVAAVGTTGTFVGTARRLKDLNSAIVAVAIEPDSPLHGVEGVKHLDTAAVPGIWDVSLRDRQLRVSTEAAQAAQRYLARREGLLVGTSSGAALVGALEVARSLDRGAVVTIFPDGGGRYLSDRHWTEGDEVVP